jgi:FMN phosphatase YigB (HAD superfamily)
LTARQVIKGIIFDLGNVLLDFDHTIAANRLSGFTDKDRQQIYNLFFDSELTHLFEDGKISPSQFFSQVKEILNLRLGYDEFVPIWNEIFFFSEKNLQVYNLASGLKGKYQITLLSNINVLHFEYIKKTFPILDAFHNIITSFETGFSKPSPAIYKKALQVLGAEAQNVFYTDDRAELVESARQLGIQGFVFKSPDQLKKDLQGLGINV